MAIKLLRALSIALRKEAKDFVLFEGGPEGHNIIKLMLLMMASVAKRTADVLEYPEIEP